MSEQVTIFEVGPRDGLQNEKQEIATKDKVHLVNLLSACGYSKIEVASFVSPKWVPQMADGGEVMAAMARRAGTRYAALTPNMQGLQRALEAGADEVAIFGSASEGFSQANINCSIAESLERFKPVARDAQQAGVPVRGYLSCVIECPYDGPTPQGQVADIAERLMELGCYEVSLGDTIGKGTPDSTRAMFDVVLRRLDATKLAGHFHDTGGRAIENIAVSLKCGLRVFDTSIAGLGGCPYAPGSAGNVDTLAVQDLAVSQGFETGLDREKLDRAAEFARTLGGQHE